MDPLPSSRRIVGALALLAELAAVGAEYAAIQPAAHDELTVRRQRVARPRRARSKPEAHEAAVKAL